MVKDVATKKVSEKVWKNGEFVNWDDARIHVMSHVVHYGSSVFEGIRCYKTENGSAVFRLTEHIQRLFNSAKIYRMDFDFDRETLIDATVNLIAESGLEECYIRPVVLRGREEGDTSFVVHTFPKPAGTHIAVCEAAK